jgi:flagellar basal-body rod protein FlgB
VPFAEFWAAQGADPTRAPRDLIRADAHPISVSPDGNTVTLEHEMMRAVEARQQHEMALGIYSMTRDLMRATIGR